MKLATGPEHAGIHQRRLLRTSRNPDTRARARQQEWPNIEPAAIGSLPRHGSEDRDKGVGHDGMVRGSGAHDQNLDLAAPIAREMKNTMSCVVQDEIRKQTRAGGLLNRKD